MIKCQVTENFSLNEFDKIKNIKRKSADVYGKLYKDDIFECDEKMAKYLGGENHLNKKVVEIIEIIPEETKEKAKVEEIAPKPKTTRKSASKKTRKKTQD